jgi:hypothetical protein
MTTTKKKYIQHNKQCFACGQEKGAAFLGYDIKTLKTYCLNKCKNKQAIPAVELVPATNEELVSAIVGNYSKDDEEAIMSLLGKVASTRLKPAHILHVMKIAEMEGTPSIQATLLNIIEADMDARNMDHVELESFGLDREPEEEVNPSDYARTKEEINEMIQSDKRDLSQYDFTPSVEPIKEGEAWGNAYPEPIKVVINEKTVEPAKEEESDDDNPFEI